MKITKRQLKRIIKEERARILKEQYGNSIETGSDLIEFAKAYAGLGSAVQQQVDVLANAYIIQGAHVGEWDEVVYEQNPAAIDMAEQRLTPTLKRLADEGSEDAEYLLDMIEAAQEIYRQGDAEVEADARAAGDIP